MATRRRRNGRPDGTRARDDLPRERWWRLWAVLRWTEAPRPPWRSALIFSVGWATFGAFVLTVIIGVEFFRTHEKPLERVTVIDSREISSGDCNRYRHIQFRAWIVTYRSANPPSHFPAEYSEFTCYEPSVGASFSAVRRLNGTEFTTYANPPRQGRTVLEAFALTFAMSAPVLFVGRLAWVFAAVRLKRWWTGRSPGRLLRRRR